MRHQLFCAVATVLWLKAALAHGQGILPASSEPEFDAGRYEWVERHLVEALGSLGRVDPDSIDEAEDILRWTSVWGDRTWMGIPRPRTDELVVERPIAEWQDPLVLTCIARHHIGQGSMPEAIAAARRSRKFLEGSAYKEAQRAFISAWNSFVLDQGGNYPERDAVQRRAVDDMVTLATSVEMSPAEQRYLSLQLPDFPGAWNADVADEVFVRLADAGGEGTWLREWLVGGYCNSLAWKLRGQGFAHTVPPEEWEQIVQLWREAERRWTSAHTLEPRVVGPASRLIGLSRSLGDRAAQSPRHWFEQVTAVWPEQRQAHYSMLYSLTPRWGGSVEEMLTFCRDATESLDPDARLHALFLDFVSLLVVEYDSDLSFMADDDEFANEVLTLVNTIEQRSIESRAELDRATVPGRDQYEIYTRRIAILRTQQAVYAWWAERFDLARSALLAEDPPLDFERIWRYGPNPEWVAAETLLCSGPTALEGLKGRGAAKAGSYVDAAGHFRAALEQLDGSGLPEREVQQARAHAELLFRRLRSAERDGREPWRAR